MKFEIGCFVFYTTSFCIAKYGFDAANPCRMAKDPRFQRLPCTHKGIYADDCIVARIQMVCTVFITLYLQKINIMA